MMISNAAFPHALQHLKEFFSRFPFYQMFYGFLYLNIVFFARGVRWDTTCSKSVIRCQLKGDLILIIIVPVGKQLSIIITSAQSFMFIKIGSSVHHVTTW